MEQKRAAKKFTNKWEGKGYEKGESASFWLSLLSEVCGIENPDEYIRFEDKVMLDHTSFIDGYMPSTHVLIEQKSIDKDLGKAIRQSDGSLLTPFQQAKRYSSELPYSERPRWVVISNFKEFRIYDMEKPTGEPSILYLEDLENQYYRLAFLVDKNDENIKKAKEVSIKAGELVGVLYKALLKEYDNPESEKTLHDLNTLCVRLVFCFYAEDSGLFGRHSMFHDYLIKHKGIYFRDALIKLFKILDQKQEDRDQYLEDDLASFPYVNGGLFENKNFSIPRINEEIIDIILNRASVNFDWSKISPTIFGGVFESTLNPETRHSGGMHYTSIDNIHKVIDPLFMNELNEEFDQIKLLKTTKIKDKRLKDFQDKIASLKFLDPAAGSGNFLTETYITLRKMENKILELLYGNQIVLGIEVLNPVKVSINQFYGIEINDFAVTVATTALWIAESQMLQETENIIRTNLDFLPIKNDAKIVEANALKLDWKDVIAKDELNYIMGNPPFLGYSNQTEEQKKDIKSIYIDENGKPYKTAGKIDYVSSWFFKATEFLCDSRIKASFVTTSSITQGEQVSSVWKPIYERFNIKIDFAYKSFKWNNEASNQAEVYVSVIGFSNKDTKVDKILYESGTFKKVDKINPYLVEGPVIFIDSKSRPICDVLEMTTGNRPAEGGNLIIEERDYLSFVSKEPESKKYIKNLTGSTEFINNKKRYCLWLVDVSPHNLRKMPEVLKRIDASRKDRLNGAPDRQKLAKKPALFREIKNPNQFLLIPKVSSSRRNYVPMGYLGGDTIVTDLAFIIPEANLFYFGILTSNVHMSWMRAVGGRYGEGYRYSVRVVYNNFPWPNPSEKQITDIKNTAQSILDARELYPDSTLADLYDELTMPPELRKAHQENDKVVMETYGFNFRTMTESECVAELMNLYKKLIAIQN